MVFVKAVRNQIVPPLLNDEVRRTTGQPTPFGYCPFVPARRLSLAARPHCTTARRNRCQEDLNSFPLGELEKTRPHATWMKTIQQDMKSNKLSLNEAIGVAQNRPFWRVIGAKYS